MKIDQINKQATISIIVNYLGLLIAFLNVIFKAKVLSQEEIGLIATITTLAGIFQYISQLGIPSIVLKYYPTKSENERNGFLLINIVIILMLLIFSITIFLIIKGKILEIYNSILLQRYVNYIIAYLCISTITSIFSIFLRVLYKTIAINIYRNMLIPIMHIMLLVIFYTTKISFNTYFIIYTLILCFIALLLIITFIIANRNNVKVKIPHYKSYKEYLKYGLYMFSASLAGTLVTKIDKIMIGSMLDLKDVGVYTITVKLASVMSVVGAAYAMIIHTKLANLFIEEDKEKINKLYKENAVQQSYLGIFICFSIINIGDEFLIMLGENYLYGYYCLIFLAIGELANLVTGMCGGIIAYSKYYKYDLYFRFILLFLAIVTNIIFIPMFGVTGAAIATGATLTIYNILKVAFVYNKFGYHPFTMKILQFLVINILLFIISRGLISNFINGLIIVGILFILYEIIAYYIINYKNIFSLILLRKTHV